MRLFLLASLLLLHTATANKITKESFYELSSDKGTFVKFFAPWCGHCKAMAPAWDLLMDEFKDSETIFVAECDCTGSCKALCEEVGVNGYPTIKYGTAGDLQDYKGGRDFDSMKAHALTHVKVSCSIKSRGLCSESQNKTIQDVENMNAAEIKSALQAVEDEITSLESKFKQDIEKLQNEYMTILKKKESEEKEIKNFDFRVMKSILATLKT